MSRILVLGGGVIGLSMAMMLARQGHSVTILEHDSEPLPVSPEAAWCNWGRQGVAQFRMPHYLHPPVRQLLETYLPDVKEALLRADCVTFDVLATMPLSVTDRTPRKGDERFITITGRRPTIEYAFASIAERLFPVRHGVAVVGLLKGPSDAKGIPHVTGVRTVDGEEVFADLIIDAMGRGSRPSVLAARLRRRRRMDSSITPGISVRRPPRFRSAARLSTLTSNRFRSSRFPVTLALGR